jgi:hypothetical protein
MVILARAVMSRTHLMHHRMHDLQHVIFSR